MNQSETSRPADERAEAWRVPPRRYLRDHPPAYEGARLSSSNAVMQRAEPLLRREQ